MAKKIFPLLVRLGAIDKISAPIKRINNSLRDMTAPVRKLRRELGGFFRESGFSRMNKEAGRFVKRLAFAATGAGFGFKRGFIDTAAVFERARISLNALYGDVGKGGEVFRQVQRQAEMIPFTFSEALVVVKKLKSANIDPFASGGSSGPLQVLADAVARVGGTGYEFTELGRQLGQMIGKQKILMEDAEAFINRGINPYQMIVEYLARTKNKVVSIADVMKAGSEGKLGKSAVKAFLEQLEYVSNGASATFMQSWTGLMSNLVDLWDRIVVKIMDSGPFQVLKTELKTFIDTVKASDIDTWAAEAGQGIVDTLRMIKSFMMAIHDLMGPIVGIFTDLSERFGGTNVALTTLGVLLGGKLLFAAAALIATLATLGWIPVAIAAVIGSGAALIANWKSVKEWFKSSFFGWLKKEFLNLASFLPGSLSLFGSAFKLGRQVIYGDSLSSADKTISGKKSEVAVKVQVRSDSPGTKADITHNTGVDIDLDQGFSWLMGGQP